MTAAALDFQVVDMHVARNPVARAIAKRRITDAVRDFQIRLYHLEEGEDVAADVHAAMHVLTCCLLALELLGRGREPDASVMRGAQSALLQCARRGNTWHTADLAAIDTGLQRAVEIFPELPAREVALAWQQMQRIERGEPA